jgi:hypothetical protein
MKDGADRVYEFVFRGLLTEQALDRTELLAKPHSEVDHDRYASLLSLNALDDEDVSNARAMATVYTAIAAFENSVRKLIAKTLLEEVGENWWTVCVSEKIREQAQKRIDEEEKVRWHAQRGEDPISYTMLPNLLSIIRLNQERFAPFIHDVEWAAAIFDIVERSRNVIMHSGSLDARDVARLGTFIRDWTAQVAT